jgi:hypothetical protein
VLVSHTEALAAALRARGDAVDVQLIAKRRHADTVVALARPGGFRIPELLEEVSAFAAGVPARGP